MSVYLRRWLESRGIGSGKDIEGGVGMVLARDGTDVVPEIDGNNNKLRVIVVKPWQQNLVEQRMKAETVALPASAVQTKYF